MRDWFRSISRLPGLYKLIIVVCLVGFAWLGLVLTGATINGNAVGNVCYMKQLTGVPCPSCGGTRSVMAILEGRLLDGFLINPLGYVIFLCMIVLPGWLLRDLWKAQYTLLEFYKKAELAISRPLVAYPLVCLILINWIWNISKGL